MLKLITLAACVIAFIFIGPKALAEFQQGRPRTEPAPSPNGKDSGEEPKSGIAA